jgi:hypothetical protein
MTNVVMDSMSWIISKGSMVQLLHAQGFQESPLKKEIDISVFLVISA